MSKRRIAVPALVALAAFAAPAAASAATLAPGKPCFGDGDPITLNGAGYTPNSSVGVSVDGRPFSGTLTTTTAGTFRLRFPLTAALDTKSRKNVFAAAETANPASLAQTTVRRVRLRVSVTPASAGPQSTRHIRAYGFTTGSTLYRHIVRGKAVSTRKAGKLKGSCKSLSTKQRLFRRRPTSGTYRIQFDTKRKYSPKTTQQFRIPIRVYRTVRRSSAASAGGPGDREVRTSLP